MARFAAWSKVGGQTAEARHFERLCGVERMKYLLQL